MEVATLPRAYFYAYLLYLLGSGMVNFHDPAVIMQNDRA